MPRWEYCRLGWQTAPITAEERAELERQGRQAEILTDGDVAVLRSAALQTFGPRGYKTPVVDVETEIANLGEGEWEMVSHIVTAVPAPDGRTMGSGMLYFKRPLPR